MNLEVIKLADLENIRHLQPEGWSDIVKEFEFYVKAPYCRPIQVKINNRIAGVGASIEFDNTAWLAHIIVDINHRRQGIRYLIVKELVNHLRRKSIETCLLIASEMGRPVYDKAGFRFVAEYTYMKREYIINNIFFSKNIRGFRKKYAEMIFQLDKQVTGENRKRILKEYLKNSYVYQDKGKIYGYYLPALREGLIIADNEQAGEELMKLKFSTHNKIVLPSDNVNAIAFLENNGFVKASGKATRMIYGIDIEWSPEKIFSRIGGNLG